MNILKIVNRNKPSSFDEMSDLIAGEAQLTAELMVYIISVAKAKKMLENNNNDQLCAIIKEQFESREWDLLEDIITNRAILSMFNIELDYDTDLIIKLVIQKGFTFNDYSITTDDDFQACIMKMTQFVQDEFDGLTSLLALKPQPFHLDYVFYSDEKMIGKVEWKGKNAIAKYWILPLYKASFIEFMTDNFEDVSISSNKWLDDEDDLFPTAA